MRKISLSKKENTIFKKEKLTEYFFQYSNFKYKYRRK